MVSPEVKITQYDFEEGLVDQLNANHFAKNLWPLVYILSDGKNRTAYVGETTDAFSRMRTHLKHESKGKLKSVQLITSEKFNKSATLDIEANLIKYMSGDEVFTLLNGNLGLANHNYYQKKEVYWDLFDGIWNQLRAAGITKHSLQHIDNSDLFKYSPYKSLTREQRQGLYEILKSLATGNYKNTIVEGGAGTGKTILAIFLFKILSSHLDDFSFKDFGDDEKIFIDLVEEIRQKLPNPKMALVVPMSSFRATLRKVFKNIKGLDPKMVIGPTEVSKEKFDLLVVDESHRLRRRVNLTNYRSFDEGCERLGLDRFNCSELDWVLMQAENVVLFYDEGQSIKPTDTPTKEFKKLKENIDSNVLRLKSQFRVKGGNAYVDFVEGLLQEKTIKEPKKFNSKDYEFLLFDNIDDMIGQIKKRDDEGGLSRLIAGFSWEWISKNDKSLKDIRIGERELMWNATSNDWINSKNSVHEVGCIHTTQGYDLNYSGIIFGNEISYDPQLQKIIVKPENYHDKNGKNTIKDIGILKDYIINIYKTLMLRGIKGTYVYVCDPLLRSYFESFIPKFLDEPEKLKVIFMKEGIIPYVNAIPFIDLNSDNVDFDIDHNIHETKWIGKPEDIEPSKDLFVVQNIGESMNQVLRNGSYCLFKKYGGGSTNGQLVLTQKIGADSKETKYIIREHQSKNHYGFDKEKYQSSSLKSLSTSGEYFNTASEEAPPYSFSVIGIFVKTLD